MIIAIFNRMRDKVPACAGMTAFVLCGANHKTVLSVALLAFALSACSSNTYHKGPRTVAELIDQAHEGRKAGKVPPDVKVGRPYTIMGKRYTPYYNAGYQETGLASWYGPGFHGKSTANGERFDENDLTAAHKTLPLPCLVKVENLENGRELVVRVNDRGPFADGRVIDLSKRSAELLGSDRAGIARVRVTYLEQDTRQLWTALNLRLPKKIPSTAPTVMMAERAQVQRPLAPASSPEVIALAELPKPIREEDVPVIVQAAPAPVEPKAIHWASLYAGDAAEEPEIIYAVDRTLTGKPRFIQAAAYANRHRASQAASELSPYGNVMLESIEVNGQPMYRVRLGPLSPNDPAHILHTRIVDLGFTDASLVY